MDIKKRKMSVESRISVTLTFSEQELKDLAHFTIAYPIGGEHGETFNTVVRTIGCILGDYGPID